jgi:hypothetical protein
MIFVAASNALAGEMLEALVGLGIDCLHDVAQLIQN